jgi:hypothetical protein
MTQKLHSPYPFFFLTALLGLAPVLSNKYPATYFPAVSPWWVEVVSVGAGVLAAFLGFSRLWAILEQRERARSLVRAVVENRHPVANPRIEEAANPTRIVSRLVRNVDQDLFEIQPDFTLASLYRLQKYLPDLMKEVENEKEARIRLGIVGTYWGETLCRTMGWQWHFRPDPALKQFSYLASVLRKGEKELDPFAWSAELMLGKKTTKDFLGEAKK